MNTWIVACSNWLAGWIEEPDKNFLVCLLEFHLRRLMLNAPRSSSKPGDATQGALPAPQRITAGLEKIRPKWFARNKVTVNKRRVLKGDATQGIRRL